MVHFVLCVQVTRGGSSDDEDGATERKTQLPFTVSKDTVQGSLAYCITSSMKFHW